MSYLNPKNLNPQTLNPQTLAPSSLQESEEEVKPAGGSEYVSTRDPQPDSQNPHPKTP